MAGMQKNISDNSKAAKTIARGALTVMSAFVISNLVGLLAKTLTARYFGTGIESNAFFTANRFSEILFNLVAGGALGSAFIPVFTGLLAKNENQKRYSLSFTGIFICLYFKNRLSNLLRISAKGFTNFESGSGNFTGKCW